MRKINKEMFDETFKAFLNGQKPNTVSGYSTCLRYWIEFSHMNGKASLQFKKDDTDARTEKLVLAFRTWLQTEKKQAENSARVATACIRGFYHANRLPLVFTQQETKKLSESNRTTEDHLFTKNDIARMTEVSNLTERYVLIVGKSVGLRASDFIGFTYGQYRSLDLESEAPIALGKIATKKEHVPAFPFLDSDAIPVVKAILERDTEKKDSDKVLDTTEESLTQKLQALYKKAKLKNGTQRIRFHNLRKYLIDRLSAVASESQWKQIVGKAISESAYVSQDQLREIYLRAMPSIVIGNGNGKTSAKVEELESENETLRNLLIALIGKEKIDSALAKTIKSENGNTEEIIAKMSTKEKLRLYEMTVRA